MIVEVGAVVSVDLGVATRPEVRAYGCTPISANKLTVACCMFGSGVKSGSPRPHDHCTVPAPKTSAPLDARYSDMRWIAVWPDRVVLP
jgi:hypothetical protein